jgi:hypothetical protein
MLHNFNNVLKSQYELESKIDKQKQEGILALKNFEDSYKPICTECDNIATIFEEFFLEYNNQSEYKVRITKNRNNSLSIEYRQNKITFKIDFLTYSLSGEKDFDDIIVKADMANNRYNYFGNEKIEFTESDKKLYQKAMAYKNEGVRAIVYVYLGEVTKPINPNNNFRDYHDYSTSSKYGKNYLLTIKNSKLIWMERSNQSTYFLSHLQSIAITDIDSYFQDFRTCINGTFQEIQIKPEIFITFLEELIKQ